MRLVQLEADGSELVAVVEVQTEKLRVRMRRLSDGQKFDLTNDVERFERRFPLWTRQLAEAVNDVLDGRKTVPVEIQDPGLYRKSSDSPPQGD